MSDLRRLGALGLNVFLIVLGTMLLYSYGSAQLARRAMTLNPAETLPPIAGVDFTAHARTLVIVVRAGCVFAERSMPFYRRLQQLQAGGVTSAGLVAVLPDDRVTASNLLRIHDLDVPSAPNVPLASLKMTGTPAIVLVDRDRTVVRVWEGLLSPAAESEVLAAIGVSTHKTSQSGRVGATPAADTSERR